jgi:hypothetical protein
MREWVGEIWTASVKLHGHLSESMGQQGWIGVEILTRVPASYLGTAFLLSVYLTE